jgi:hypothetical protein
MIPLESQKLREVSKANVEIYLPRVNTIVPN